MILIYYILLKSFINKNDIYIFKMKTTYKETVLYSIFTCIYLY